MAALCKPTKIISLEPSIYGNNGTQPPTWLTWCSSYCRTQNNTKEARPTKTWNNKQNIPKPIFRKSGKKEFGRSRFLKAVHGKQRAFTEVSRCFTLFHAGPGPDLNQRIWTLLQRHLGASYQQRPFCAHGITSSGIYAWVSLIERSVEKQVHCGFVPSKPRKLK